MAAEPGADIPVAAPGAFLLDQRPAVTWAGMVTELAQQLGAWKIDPEIAFLSADYELSTPFARTLRALESAPWHERRFARKLRDLGIGPLASGAAGWQATQAAQDAGIHVHRSQVRRILLAEKVRWRRTRSWAASTDPEFAPKGPRSSSSTPPRWPVPR